MQIGYIVYPVLTLGYGKRIGLWLCGCGKECKNCMSPELRSTDNGQEIQLEDLIKKIEKWTKEADGITISGGEPFDQSHELAKLVKWLIDNRLDDILIYTGYRTEWLLEVSEDCRYCIESAAAIIDGEYIPEQNDGKGIRGSKNQSIRVNRYQERYENVLTMQRYQQSILLSDKMIVIGIPDSEDK